MIGLQELIDRKTSQIEYNNHCIKQDKLCIDKSSKEKERLEHLLLTSRTRKNAQLMEELELLYTIDKSFRLIMSLVEHKMTKYESSVFNQIWNTANKPYANTSSNGVNI